jgi:hypothetical protein|tara:strand:- start:246 stop:578 length:333 start_codon:yes stop_codon:yes gene_type:complete
MTPADKSHKTLEFMTAHMNDIKQVSFGMYSGVINELSNMANGDDLCGERDRLYNSEIHTDQFFVDLLNNLGYDKDGDKLSSDDDDDEDSDPEECNVMEGRRLQQDRYFYI